MPESFGWQANLPDTLPEILRTAERGDWRLRTACLSAAGRAARAEAGIRGVWRRLVLRAHRFGPRQYSAGHEGRHVRVQCANGLVDRSWPVRVAAALALGDCRSPTQIAALERRLLAPLRAERIAAACAIVSCGGSVPVAGSSLLAGAESAPAFVGDTTRSIDVLTSLAAAHPEVLACWRSIAGQPQPTAMDAAAWGAFLAGAPVAESSSGIQAEIDRYDGESDTAYLLAKPFSPADRTHSSRLLHTFAAVCEQLQIPPGARVLDLGGGSGWVSEFLARFGFVPITVDVSSALLTVGRERFARAALTPRFVAADMTRLPIASASVGAVVVMDALHHVPDVPAVVREAFRVLEPGGVFVLAEPGEGHAEAEKSRSEVHGHHVHEREIHVFEVIDYMLRAGFDDVRVVPNHEPAIAMTAEQLSGAMTSSADDWLVLHENRPTYLASYLMQTMLAHPIVVGVRGRRVCDSLVPSVLRADIVPGFVRDGARVSGLVTVRNTGDTIWRCGDGRGHVRVGIQLVDMDRTVLARDFSRARLAADVAPNGTAEVAVTVTLPDASTAYLLKVDLVDEGVCWFEDAGSRPVYVAV